MVGLYILAGVVGIPILGLAALWIIGENGHIFGLPSTRAAIAGEGPNPGSQRSIFMMLHGYVYSRFPVRYIKTLCAVLPRMGPTAKQIWADHYHGKTLPTDLARQIITLDHDIPRVDLEHIIPYPVARHLVLNASPTVLVMDCPCRGTRENPCEPVRVCMIFGDGGFVSDHHPDKVQRITQHEALDLLQAEHERGHVHVAYFKDACNDQFFALCNCCSCCCGGIEAMRVGSPMVSSSGFVAQINPKNCEACGTCRDACPFGAISLNGHSSVHYDKCMGCGVCVDKCPEHNIKLIRDEAKGTPLDVRTLGV